MSKKIILNITPQTNVESCVYRIWFGDYYYIGTTKTFKKRIAEHSRQLSKELDIFNPRGTYHKIVLYLKKSGIREGKVEVLLECPPDRLYQAEREFHLIAFADDRCLNVFYHHRTRIKALSVPLPSAK